MSLQLGAFEVSIILAAQVAFIWWLKSAIKHEYDKKLEFFKSERLRKDKAAVVAEFFAEWTHVKDSDTKRLNQLLWELSLYLPSDLVRELNALSRGSPDAKSAQELLVAVRNYLFDGKDPVDPQVIGCFKHPDNMSMISRVIRR
jgi:hypothetical protein